MQPTDASKDYEPAAKKPKEDVPDVCFSIFFSNLSVIVKCILCVEL